MLLEALGGMGRGQAGYASRKAACWLPAFKIHSSVYSEVKSLRLHFTLSIVFPCQFWPVASSVSDAEWLLSEYGCCRIFSQFKTFRKKVVYGCALHYPDLSPLLYILKVLRIELFNYQIFCASSSSLPGFWNRPQAIDTQKNLLLTCTPKHTVSTCF